MGFIKKKLFMILCIVLALAGFSLLIPGFMTASTSKKSQEELESKSQQVQSLRKQAAELTESVLQQYAQNAEKASKDRDAVLERVAKTTERDLIFADVFPEPSGISITVKYRDFAQEYCQAVNGYLKYLNAGDRPSILEEQKIREEYQRNMVKSTSGGMSGTASALSTMDSPGGGGGRSGAATGGFRTAGGDILEEKQVESFRKKQAEGISIYANTDSFCAWDNWKNFRQGEKESLLKESWLTQLAAWIQEDVVLSIKQINGDSPSVPKSTVKRLIEISFCGSPTSFTTVSHDASASLTSAAGRPSGGGMNTAEVAGRRTQNINILPAYVIERSSQGDSGGGRGMGGMSSMSTSGTAEGLITPAWTKRASDGTVDVVQFEVAVVIDTNRVSDFINALQSEKTSVITKQGVAETKSWRNQITVLLVSMYPLQVDAEKAGGYYYGSASLGVLRVVCEYVFFKSGYDKYKSGAVKKLFEAPAAGGGASAMPMGGKPGGGASPARPAPGGRREDF